MKMYSQNPLRKKMTELKFDTEGITSCPDKGTVTKEECRKCLYFGRLPQLSNWQTVCIYEDVFPEPSEEK